MKYFTSDWWQSGCEDESVLEKYREYFSSISSNLPKPIQELEKNHTLHDANLAFISNDFESKIVTIRLNGWNNTFDTPVNYKIKFKGVKFFSLGEIKEDSELGDLGYWEYELLDDALEMRILFASSAQCTIKFEDFTFTYENI